MLLESRKVYKDTANANTVDGSGIITEASGVILDPVPSILNGRMATNILDYSEDFSQGSWADNNISKAIGQVSPSGLMNAYTLTDDATNAAHYMRNQETGVNGNTYTMSCFAKQGTADFLILGQNIGSGVGGQRIAYFDLSDGTLGSIDNGTGSGTTSKIQICANGWYRCSVTYQLPGTTIHADVGLSTADNLRVYSGTGSSNIIAYGAQFQDGAETDDYIITQATSASRDSDDISFPLVIGENFNQSSGIVIMKGIFGYDSDTVLRPILSINEGNGLIYDPTTINSISSTDASNTITQALTFLKGQGYLVSVLWSTAQNIFSINVSLDDGTTWASWSDSVYDGGFESGTDINFFFTNPDINELLGMNMYIGLVNDDADDSKTWIEANANSVI